MEHKGAKVFGIYFIMTACLLILSLFPSTRAFAQAELHVFESRIGDHGCGSVAITPHPLGYFDSADPNLILSESFAFPSIFGHNGCQDEEFQDRKIYQDPVRVNRQRRPCLYCRGYFAGVGALEPHSDAMASGFADAGRLSLGAYSEVSDSGPMLHDIATQGQAEADTSFRNRFTVLPGSSGLPAGTPVRLRWLFRLHGSTDASGKTFPHNTATLADVNFDAKIVRELEVCQPEDGSVFCSRPTAARFGLDARTEASDSDPNNPFTLGETGSISHKLNWSAHNNLGQQLGAPVTERAVFGLQDQDSFMSRSFPVDSDSLISSLDFEATVGETLEIQANLWTLAIMGGGAGSSTGGTLGSTRNHFFGSFNNSIVDPENRGLQLIFEIPPETLNNQPVAHAGQDRAADVGNVVTLDGSASADPDNGPGSLNFRWLQKGGPVEVTLTGDTTATPTFTPPLEGTYTFRLIVNDGEFDSGPDDVVVTAALAGENQPPVAQCQNVTVPTALDSCAVAFASIDDTSSDPDGDTLFLSQSPAGPYTLGNTEITLTVSDGALSNQCTATVTVIDGQAPTITCPTDQSATATSSNGTVVTFAPIATDNCTTLITSCTPASGSAFTPGTTLVSCTATDGAGLQNSCSFNVNVSLVYPFTGFFQPVDNVPTFNTVKAGQSIPIKFSLGGNYGLGILTAGSPTSQPIDCPNGGTVDDVEQVVMANNSGLQYDALTDTYTYVWKTLKAWAGQCRQLNVTLSDGTSHTVNFQFK